ncbi:MAG TPA: hypothetical protein DEF34_08520 [Desulfotomaculum sp.]|nr:MAG: hypothetical protein JL56_07140 [Desulfotomaculum sp. BICA1-6]HBX23656.1 hypothetical protein [Desulfotomaculum sp.]
MRGRGLPKLLCIVVVLSLAAFLWGGVALAGFSDVTDSHWAKMNIDKMSARGVTGGYPDGTFQPNQTVTQAEAVCMAVRALGLQASSNSLPEVSFPVPEWAKSDIKLAVHDGLLKNNDQFSAYSGASRAWIARLLVRMINKESEAEERLLMPNFTDTYLIPDWAVYYVRVAQDNDLIAGYADKSFKPDQPVTRAELVSFLSRVEKHQPARDLGYITGSIVSVSSSQISITADDGRSLSFSIPYGFSAYEENKKTSVSQLQRADRVKLLADGATLKFLEVSPGQGVSAMLTGTVKKVYPELNAFVIELAGGELRTLYLPGNASLSVVGSTAQGLNALKPGDVVDVTLDASGYVSGIIVNSGASLGNSGFVYDLDQDAGLLILQLDNDQLKPYTMDDYVNVQVAGARFPTLGDVHTGDKVKLTMENGLVTGIELLQAAARLTVTGEVFILNSTLGVLNLEVDGELQVYRLATSVQVTVPGLTGAFLSDIGEGDTVTATVKDGQVVSLAVEGRQSGDMLTATVLAVDTGNRVLTMEDTDKKFMVYDIKREARVKVNGEDASLDDIERDMEVKFRLLDGDIIYLEVDNTIGGTVVSIDEDSLLLVLEKDNGERKTYIMDDSVDINSQDSRNELDEIERGDYAKIEIENDQVAEINLRSSITYLVTEVRENYDRINVEDEDEDSYRLYIRDGVELIIPGISNPDIEDVKEGDLVRATYIGRDLQKVEVTVNVRGEVTSINSYQDSVSIKLFNGTTTSVSFSTGSKVETGGRTYTLLTALAVGDRVDVLENMQGGSTFKVMQKVSGRLSMDGNFNEDYVYLDSGSWAPYKVHDDAYVHDYYGSLTSKSALKSGDNVDLYLLKDVVYELVKR